MATAQSTPRTLRHVTRRRPVEGDVVARIAERLRHARRARRWSQSRLADQLGISFQQIGKYERGKNRIGADLLYRCAALLGRDIAWFFEPEDAATEPPTRADSRTGPFEAPACREAHYGA